MTSSGGKLIPTASDEPPARLSTRLSEKKVPPAQATRVSNVSSTDARKPTAPTPAATILIIDDAAFDRKLIETLLTNEGYRTVSSAGGDDLAALIASTSPDLILVDFVMPGIGGCQIVWTLKTDPATAQVPIIVLTGHEDSEARLAGLLAGAEEFLTKPVDRSELVLRVRNLLRLKAHTDLAENQSAALEETVRSRTAELHRFRMALDTTGDAIFLVNRTTMRFVDTNSTACVMLGYSREELLSIGPVELSTAAPEQWAHVYDAVIARHPSDELAELEVVRKDGSRLVVEARRQAFRSGSDWLVVSVMRDITERKKAEDALKLSEFSVNIASVSTYWIASDARIVRVNRAACEQLGYTESELLELTLPDLNPTFTMERWRAHWDELRDCRRMTFETQHRRKDGRSFPVEVDLNWFEFEGREYDFAFVRDITDRKYAADQIVHLNRVYAILSRINALTVRVNTRDELFKEACQIAVDVGGFPAALVGMIDHATAAITSVAVAGENKSLLEAIRTVLSTNQGAPPDMLAQAIKEKKAVVANPSQPDARALFTEQHAEFGVRSMVIVPIIIADAVIGVLALYASEDDFFHEEELKLLNQLANDIAFAIDHIQKTERLTYLAYYDVLTGLPNWSWFLEQLAQRMRTAAASGKTLGVALIDIERFKNINDSLGQKSGDALLKQLAEWLVQNFGGTTLIARIDADHFAVTLPDVAHEGEAVEYLEKKRLAFRDHVFQIGPSAFRIAFKSGIALFPADSSDALSLFQKAEAALKNAKETGGTTLAYAQKMTDVLTLRVTLEDRLREALTNNEFVLHYQPKISLSSGKLSGAEALVRWNHPETGLVLPGQFISVLEETGLIHDVGRWVLRQAISDHLRWLHSGLPAVRVAVNVSPLQLRHRDFLDQIRAQIQVDVHAAAGLELEITESAIMEDVQRTIELLNATRNLGVAIAIDDFGTGFSSLSCLSKLPVDTLKIDQSFIAGMSTGPSGLSLVSTIINLAHSMKLNVVAEGVETEEQSRFLGLLNCDEMQGYFFCKPLPVDEFEARFLVAEDPR